MAQSPEARLFTCVAGIYFFYLYYGVLQEKLYRPLPDGAKFQFTLFLLFVQCFVNFAVAIIAKWVISTFQRGSKSQEVELSKTAKSSPLKSLFGNHSGSVWVAFISFSYLSAMGCSNAALKYVSYPTQALGKSCKIIPVMLANVFIGGKRYSLREYFCVLLITLGIIAFRLGKGSSLGEVSGSTWGWIFLFGSLCMDGITSSNQRLLADEFKPSTHNLMAYINLWSVLYLSVALLVTGEGSLGWSFCAEHPSVMRDLLSFSLCSAMGQNFIFYTVTGPGPLACTTITTTRKFFTILASVLLYPDNKLLPAQWGGVAFVFIGLGMELYGKYQKRQAAKQKRA